MNKAVIVIIQYAVNQFMLWKIKARNLFC